MGKLRPVPLGEIDQGQLKFQKTRKLENPSMVNRPRQKLQQNIATRHYKTKTKSVKGKPRQVEEESQRENIKIHTTQAYIADFQKNEIEFEEDSYRDDIGVVI